MPSPFNPVRNPLIILIHEIGLVLYQQGNEFVLSSVEGEKFFSNIEEAFNNYCRLSDDKDLFFDVEAVVENEVIQSYVDAFDTSGVALDWDLKEYDIFGNEVDMNQDRV